MNFKSEFFLYFFWAFIFIQCKSTATITEVNQLKKAISLKKIKFKADSANPVVSVAFSGLENILPPGSTIGSINLVGHSNILLIKNDSITLDMPFYGERIRVGSYNNQGNFQFKGKIDTLQTYFNDKKNSYTLKFNVKTAEENLNLILNLFAGKSADLKITSSHRRGIRYTGNWKGLKEEL
jgi:hypothetical protein